MSNFIEMLIHNYVNYLGIIIYWAEKIRRKKRKLSYLGVDATNLSNLEKFIYLFFNF